MPGTSFETLSMINDIELVLTQNIVIILLFIIEISSQTSENNGSVIPGNNDKILLQAQWKNTFKNDYKRFLLKVSLFLAYYSDQFFREEQI